MLPFPRGVGCPPLLRIVPEPGRGNIWMCRRPSKGCPPKVIVIHGGPRQERAAHLSASAGEPAGPGYRRDIDGLRAVAVLLVLGYHAFPTEVRGGFVGVDIFFVISGFLISSILFRGLAENKFTFRGFYLRRIIRIFPALFVVLAACLAIGYVALLPEEYKALAKHTAAGAGFLSNIAFWKEAGYFDTLAETKPLLHLWSLGIEEQYYIFWPLLLWVSWKRRWEPLWVCLLVIVSSFVYGIVVIRSNPVAAFYSPFTRVWELACGAALARISERSKGPGSASSKPIAAAAANFGAFLVLAAVVLLTPASKFPGWWALLPVAGTGMILAAGPDTWLNRRVLSLGPLVWIGTISYPLHLWHWPLLTFARIVHCGPPGPWIRGALLAASVVLAWLTFRVVETPIRFGTLDKRKSARVLFAAVALIGLLAVVVHRLNGIPKRFHEAIPDVLARSPDWEYPSAEMKPRELEGVTVDAVGGDGPLTLFFGDSNVQQYASRIGALLGRNSGPQRGAIFLTSAGDCPIDGVRRDDTGAETNLAAFLRLAESPKVDRVVIGAGWGGYFVEDKVSYGLFNKTTYRLRGMPLETAEGAAAAFDQLEKTVAGMIAKKKKVTLLLGIPSGNEFGRGALATRSLYLIGGAYRFYESVPKGPVEERLRFTSSRLREVARKTGASVIDPLDPLCPEGICPTTGHRDQGHLRASFVRNSVTYLDPLV